MPHPLPPQNNSASYPVPLIARASAWFCLTLAVVAAGLGCYGLMASGFSGNEDNLLFYMMGLNLFHGDALAAMADQAIAFYGNGGTDEHGMLRLEFRKTYLNEFPAPGLVYYGFSRVFLAMFQPAPGLYPLFLTQSITMGVFFALIISAKLTGLAIMASRQPVYLWAFLVTVVLFGLSELVPVTVYPFATILNYDAIGPALGHLFTLLVRPGPEFSPLGFTPRGHFALLAIGLFALRWQGRVALSYWMALAMSFVHLSTSGMLLVVLVGLDLVLRPGRLRCPAIFIPIVLAAVLFAWRQIMWALLGDSAGLVGVIAAVLVGLGVICVFVAPVRRAVASVAGVVLAPLAKVRGCLSGLSTAGADIALMAIGWTVSAVALFVVIAVFDPFSELAEFYFWGRAHGRILMALWPSVVFGLIGIILLRGSFKPAAKMVVGAVCIFATIGIGASAFRYVETRSVMEKVAGDYFKAERALKHPIPTLKPLGEEELILYYAMCKTVDLGKDLVTPLLKGN